MKGMLDGVRVIDFTGNVSGPAASTFLCDMGAEVIKLEKPGRGDDARMFPPHVNGFSAPFVVMNRGKRGVCIDLKNEEGVELFKELVAVSDVIFENHMPGTMEKFGLGYDCLKEINPRIIMLSISGFGQTGPLSHKPAYDSIIQAMTGIMSVTGFPDGPPVKSGPIIVDVATAMQSAFAVCAALYARTNTGIGEYIDMSMYDIGVNLMSGTWTEYTVTGNIQGRTGNRYPYVTPFDTFEAKDGYFMICSSGDATYHRLCDAIGMPELKNDERYDNLIVRNINREELTAVIQDWVSEYTVDELQQVMDEYSVPASPIYNTKEVVEHPHTIARNLPVDLEQPGRGMINIYGPPAKARNSDISVKGPAPEHGQDNEWLLSDILCKDANEIQTILTSGAMGEQKEKVAL